MNIYANIEKYAPEIEIFSSKSAEGRTERGFIQPLDLKSETANLPLDIGNKYGKYLLIASVDTIAFDETEVLINWAGRSFELISREELGLLDLRHIECLIRCIGGTGDA